MLKNQLIVQQHNRNASKLNQLGFIYQDIAQNMIARLDYIKLLPQRILDIGSGSGIDAKLLSKKFPHTDILELDVAIQVLKHYREKPSLLNKLLRKTNQQLCADCLNLPLQNNSFDIAWSNLCLPYIDNLKQYFSEIYRVLNVGGYFLVSGLGVDSLKEIRQYGLRTFNFPDMHIIGDILVQLGFTNPVTDIEYITLEYESPQQFINDLKIIGCGSAIQQDTNILGSATIPAIKKFLRSDGSLKITLEVYYAHAWKDAKSVDNILQFYPPK